MSLGPGWDKALGLLAELPERIKKAKQQAVLKEAHFLRGKMVENLDSGGTLAGAPFAPHSGNPLAARAFRGFGGTKILIVSGSMRNSLVVVKLGEGAFVGIHRKGAGKGGKSAADIAQIHEFGRMWTMPMTDKMRRFLFAMLRAQGLQHTRPPKAAGAGATVITIRIPPRPFIGPVLDKFATPDLVRERYTKNLAEALKGDLGKA